MFQIEALPEPLEVPIPGGTLTLTHRATALQVDPRGGLQVMRAGGAERGPLIVTEMVGYLHDGRFIDHGPHVHHVLDDLGFSDLLYNTSSGKPAGVFRTTDVMPAIEKRKAERAEAKRIDDEQAAEERRATAERMAKRRKAQKPKDPPEKE